MKIKILLILLLFLPIVFADSGNIKLLAVSEQGDEYKGSLADMYFAFSPGAGRVFIESQPLTQLDTQFSTRLARDVACEYTSANCKDYDFFYTIRANSAIVGGPSAGAAATILTITTLRGILTDNETAITGTINSGGIIGPVGRLKEKIDAASSNGIKKVLIPYGSVEEGLDLIQYGELKGVEVIEVSDIDEAIYYFTGQERFYSENISVNPKYTQIMSNIASLMCNRSMKILEKTLNYIYKEANHIPEDAAVLEAEASDLYQKGQHLIDEGKYYAAASQCFGSNIKYKQFEYKIKNIDSEEIISIANSTKEYLAELDEAINKEKRRYLSDLEAYMIVKERIVDAERNIQDAIDEESINALSYAVERANSAYMWSKFFDMDEKKIKMDEESLKESCISKTTEVNELYNYITLILPNVLRDSQEDLAKVAEYYENGDYELCLFKASKTKADMGVVLSSMNINEMQVDSLIKRKITAAKKSIIKENEKDIFPILGYSYYELSNSLKDEEKYLALVYAEYGLELSNLEGYFKDSSFSFSLPNISFDFENIDQRGLTFLIVGIILGSVGALLMSRRKRRNKFKGAIKF